MTREEWRKRALSHLRSREHRAEHERVNSGGSIANLAEWTEFEERIGHARAASPEMSREEADEWLIKQGRKGKGAGRPARPLTKAESQLWVTAAHAISLTKLWAALHPQRPRPRPPIHPHDIVAERYEIPRQQVDEYVSRCADRWPGKHRP